MRHAHVGTKYVITNADRTRFFAFGPMRRYSDTVDNLVQAELFPSGGEAQQVIDAGKDGRWSAIFNDRLLFVQAVEVSVAIDIPDPVLAAYETAE